MTSTYFEGGCARILKPEFGYGRDKRSDCRQVVIALIVTTDGLPLAYEVFSANTVDKTTPKPFLNKIEKLYGKARRVWVMDRGLPTEATLEEMRSEGVACPVGTPRSLLGKLEKDPVNCPWEEVHDGVRVKLLPRENERDDLARSVDRRKNETAMRRRKLEQLIHGVNRLERRTISRDTLLEKVAVLQRDAGRVAGLVKAREPKADEPVNRRTFVCTFDRSAWKKALDRNGCYMLRAHLPPGQMPEALVWEKQAPVLRSWHTQLVHVEETFKTLECDLGLRPMHQQIERRVEARIFVAFPAYCLTVTLRMKLNVAAAGLTQRAMILEKLNLQVPKQPPPPIRNGEIIIPPAPST